MTPAPSRLHNMKGTNEMTALVTTATLTVLAALFVWTPRCMRVGRHARGESLNGW